MIFFFLLFVLFSFSLLDGNVEPIPESCVPSTFNELLSIFVRFKWHRPEFVSSSIQTKQQQQQRKLNRESRNVAECPGFIIITIFFFFALLL